ncbi:MAG: alcohol dehydrogenase catalytic domain-containing protein, partial [Candidatus Kariarchaeaceae archaeon]
MVQTAQMQADGSVILRDMELPELQPGDVLLKTTYSEVCGTDIHLKHGRLGVPFPIIPGHVSVGVIQKIKVADGHITDVNGDILQVGDPVTFLDVAETCQSCYYCLVAKASTRCPNRKVYGITYGVKDGLKGGWAQNIYLPRGVKIIKLPSSVDPKRFIAAGCGLPTSVHAVERASIKLGDTVLVQGSGPVGLMSAVLSKLSGAFTVIMIGAPAHRLEIAKEFG